MALQTERFNTRFFSEHSYGSCKSHGTTYYMPLGTKPFYKQFYSTKQKSGWTKYLNTSRYTPLKTNPFHKQFYSSKQKSWSSK
jgi:hypothetical protein